MGNSNYDNQQHMIFDLINHTIVPHSDPVGPVCTRKLFYSVGPWISSKTLNLVVN